MVIIQQFKYKYKCRGIIKSNNLKISLEPILKRVNTFININFATTSFNNYYKPDINLGAIDTFFIWKYNIDKKKKLLRRINNTFKFATKKKVSVRVSNESMSF